ncbi:hypothetical protein [Deinococcus misasensis]|uniref:hypothetical protein n=1 Tax=Deinococcus misasensis TaxID=392413 RepID=UPI00055325F7|nr:hypothetical protein [Deinococcus misasensis]
MEQGDNVIIDLDGLQEQKAESQGNHKALADAIQGEACRLGQNEGPQVGRSARSPLQVPAIGRSTLRSYDGGNNVLPSAGPQAPL